MNALAAVQAARPSWFEVTCSDPDRLTGVARPPATLWETTGLELSVVGEEDLEIREEKPGTVLPKVCPERHIQDGGVFCLGLARPPVQRARAAVRWWQDLETFLRCQSAAEQTGLWPLQHNLDHGDAGRYHLIALRLAARLGISDEYARAYLGEPSWLTGEGLAKLELPWARARPWPAAARRMPKIRRPSQNRLRLMDLVAADAKRQRQLKAFWDDMRKAKLSCCGRMRDCPLKGR